MRNIKIYKDAINKSNSAFALFNNINKALQSTGDTVIMNYHYVEKLNCIKINFRFDDDYMITVRIYDKDNMIHVCIWDYDIVCDIFDRSILITEKEKHSIFNKKENLEEITKISA